jgi:hypothetical protein
MGSTRTCLVLRASSAVKLKASILSRRILISTKIIPQLNKKELRSFMMRSFNRESSKVV